MTHRFLRWRTASLLVALPLAVLLYAATQWWDRTAIVFPAPPRFDSLRLAATAARPVFTHSIIPGGVYSSEELRDVFQRDAVVAAHYRDADLGQMRLATLTKGKAAYVSYRVGDKVYWTRNRVWIPPGESVLTDGTVEIRARCGNCISDTRGAVGAGEPAGGVLDDSVIPPTDDARVAGFAAEAEPDLGELLTIPFGPQAFASFTPQPGDSGAPLWPQPPPFFGVPPGGLPGGPAGPDHPGDVPGDGSSPPPAPFVPGDGGPGGPPTSGGSTNGSGSGATTGGSGGTSGGSTGGTSGGTTSGTPGTTTTTATATTGHATTGASSGTPTTGTTGDTTTSGPGSTTTTGSATTGWPTTGATDTTSGIVTTNGSPTSGAVSGSTDTGHPPEAPEAKLLWLVALGALGLASRRWRRSR